MYRFRVQVHNLTYTNKKTKLSRYLLLNCITTNNNNKHLSLLTYLSHSSHTAAVPLRSPSPAQIKTKTKQHPNTIDLCLLRRVLQTTFIFQTIFDDVFHWWWLKTKIFWLTELREKVFFYSRIECEREKKGYKNLREWTRVSRSEVAFLLLDLF